jgi:hypothetical protein
MDDPRIDDMPDLTRIEADLARLADLDPAEGASLAAEIADTLGQALDALDEGQPD